VSPLYPNLDRVPPFVYTPGGTHKITLKYCLVIIYQVFPLSIVHYVLSVDLIGPGGFLVDVLFGHQTVLCPGHCWNILTASCCWAPNQTHSQLRSKIRHCGGGGVKNNEIKSFKYVLLQISF
jgi:hypothetical protein